MSRLDQAKLLAKTASQLAGATFLAAIALFGGGAEIGDRKMTAALVSSGAFLVFALIFHLVADHYEPQNIEKRQFARNRRMAQSLGMPPTEKEICRDPLDSISGKDHPSLRKSLDESKKTTKP